MIKIITVVIATQNSDKGIGDTYERDFAGCTVQGAMSKLFDKDGKLGALPASIRHLKPGNSVLVSGISYSQNSVRHLSVGQRMLIEVEIPD